MRRPHRFIRAAEVKILLLVAATLLLLFASSGRVGAKGPASATFSGPGIAQPVALVVSDNRELVTRLMEQTGLWFATGNLPQPLAEPPESLGPAYTLAWINGGPPDKSVEERTIHQLLYLDGDGRLLIYTPEQEALAGWGPGVLGWFEAPAGLRETLAELGVPVSELSSSSGALAADPGVTYRYAGIVGLLFLSALVGTLLVRRQFRSRPHRLAPGPQKSQPGG